MTAGRKSTPRPSYPNRIREIREAQKRSLAAVGKKSGMSKDSLSDAETGERQLRVSELERIAEALGAPIWALLNGFGEEEPSEDRLLQVFRSLSDDDRRRLLAIGLTLAFSRDGTR